ncbi:MAG TPA: phosphoglycerate dehydrogenase [Xanthobacteraceae bacterium]|nr:phosphoglycerate dehydrogenase [Xanthobacteraceae bacterium]
MTFPRMRAVVTTVPFGSIDPAPLKILAEAGIETVINPIGRRLKAGEVAGVISGFDIVIAGTETITAAALAAAPSVKAICRVGIGLDGIDLLAARHQGIAVSYTPDGPSPAVAELAVGLMLDLLRGVGHADRGLRSGQWNRYSGRRLAESTIGIVGCGRIGSRVIGHLLGGFPGVRILAHDIAPSTFACSERVEWVGFEELLGRAEVISLHVPLTPQTRGMIGAAQIAALRHDAILINTARGGIIDEAALFDALQANRLAGAAIDVFEEEPYAGPLARCENAVLTCHMGSMTRDCRLRMEVEAAAEAARFARGEALLTPVPEAEYELAAGRLVPTP